MPKEQNLDLLISGSGLIGTSLACALAKTGLRIGLVDPLHPGQKKEDGRLYAISYGSAADLRDWGIWERVEAHVTPIQKIRITQKGGGDGLTYQATDVGVEALGFMVPSLLLQQAVWEQLKTCQDITLLMPDTVKAWKPDDRGLCVTLESGLAFRTSLLAGAEGRMSRLREAIGGSTLKHPYNQTALVLTVAHSQEHHHIAFEHFTPDGPLAFLPLQGKRSAVVWSLSPARAAALAADPHVLLHALIHHFGWGLGDLRIVSPIQTYPLSLIMPYQTWDVRTVLLGDAAHVIHPLAGQGLNVGLRDVAILSQKIRQAHALGLDIGSITLLEQMGKERRGDHWSMAALTHGLVRLFQWDNPLLNRGVALGFWGVQRFSPLKKFLTRRAMGVHS